MVEVKVGDQVVSKVNPILVGVVSGGTTNFKQLISQPE